MKKQCVVCGNWLALFSCGNVCSIKCRSANRKGESFATVKIEEVSLLILFQRAVTQSNEKDAFDTFLESVKHDPKMVDQIVKEHFVRDYGQWKAMCDNLPTCPYCDEIVNEDGMFCSDDCQKTQSEREEKEERNAQRRAQRRMRSVKCKHCEKQFETNCDLLYCGDDCRQRAAIIRRSIVPKCEQCGITYRRTKHHQVNDICIRCDAMEQSKRRAVFETEAEQKRFEFEEMCRINGIYQEGRIFDRELRSMASLKTEHRARLRHYADLTSAIDKGELVNVVRK